MLVFKNNIYEPYNLNKPNVIATPDTDYNQRFDPRRFIGVALTEEKEVLSFIERQPRPYWREDLLQFYRHAGKTNSLNYLSGDVLTGIIAGLAAQNISLQNTAIARAYIHGLSGDLFSEKGTQTSLIAGDLLRCLPDTLKQILP